jgi:hypothetical protein
VRDVRGLFATELKPETFPLLQLQVQNIGLLQDVGRTAVEDLFAETYRMLDQTLVR